jgi:hypothetical protein
MGRPSVSCEAADLDDFYAFPNPHLKAMVMRLRIEMKSCAAALQGELADEFWRLVDELNAMRSAKER